MVFPFVLLASWSIGRFGILKGYYIPQFLIAVIIYFYLSKVENKMMQQLKERSDVFKVVNENANSDMSMKTITVGDVRKHLRHNRETVLSHVIVAFIVVPLPCLLLPLCGFANMLISYFEMLPHNYLRLLLHLKRIEKQQGTVDT